MTVKNRRSPTPWRQVSPGRRSHRLTGNQRLGVEQLEQRAMLCSVPLQTGPIINEANGHTYYLLEASTWTEAEAAAVQLGGNLVTINDAAEDAWVRETFGDSNQFGLWTGLHDQQTEGEFVWTSGEPVTYTNWASGQPDNYNGEEDFVMLYTDAGGRWADYSDRATTAGRPLQGVVETPSFINPANGHTYIKLSPSTWSEAEARSVKLGGHLVTINDVAEQEWVFETFSDDSQFGLWIGLNDRNQEGEFVWASGQPVTYTNWGSEQPDNFNGAEDYAMMFVEDGGAWYDFPDYAYEGGTTGRPLHGIMEYEGIRNWQTSEIIHGTEVLPPGSCINLDGQNLRFSDFSGRDLMGSSFVDADLTLAWLADANLSQANLTGASFELATLNHANLSKADLSRADFQRTTLTNADLSWANLSDASFWSSNLHRADLKEANLRNTFLSNADLSAAALNNAEIRGANFEDTIYRGLTSGQFYSTASYQANDLSGIQLGSNDLHKWDFRNQNLERASLAKANLAEADFTGASLKGGDLGGSTLSNANFSNADLALANLAESVDFVPAASTIIRSAILPDRHIHGLEILDDEVLTVPNRWGNADVTQQPPPVTVSQKFSIASGATLVMEANAFCLGTLECGPLADASSQLAPEAGVSIELGGNLRIVPREFRTRARFKLFDWPEPLEPDNQFLTIEIPAGGWNLSALYTTGVIHIQDDYAGDGDFDVDGQWTAIDIDRLAISLRGAKHLSYDVNHDRILDEADHLAWVEEIAGTRLGDANLDQTIDFSDFLNLSRNFGESGGWAEGDFNADGEIDFADFLLLSRNYGRKASVAAAVESSRLLALPKTRDQALADAALVAIAMTMAYVDAIDEFADPSDPSKLNELIPEAVERRNLADTAFAEVSEFL